MTDFELKQFQNEVDEESIDFRRYLTLYISNWYWFAISLFIALCIGYGVNRYSEKTYSVSSTLLIKDDLIGGGLTGADAILPGGALFNNKQNLSNEIGILRSYSLNKRVVDSLPDFNIEYIGIGRRNIVETRLYKDSPIIVIPDTTTINPTGQIRIRILSQDEYRVEINGNLKIQKDMKFGDILEVGNSKMVVNLRDAENFTFDPSFSNKYVLMFHKTPDIANQYRSRLNISPIVKDASMVTIKLSGPVYEQDVDYLNMLMHLYIARGLELKNETANSTLEFIDNQIMGTFKTLSEAETELENFRRNENLIDLSSEGALLQGNIEKIESERVQLELQKKYYKYLADYLSSKEETGDIVSPAFWGISDTQLAQLVGVLSRLQLQKKELALSIRNDLPPIGLIEEEIKRTRTALNESIEGGVSSINLTLEDVNTRMKTIEAQIDKLPGTEREMIRIQRKFDINNTVYTFLLEKRAEIGIAKASNISDNRVIDEASNFNVISVKPNIRRNYLMSVLFGLLIPAICLFILDSLNNRILDRKDVEHGTKAPVIGYINHSDYKSELPVNERPGSTLAESFRLLRTNIKYLTKEKQNPIIAISSTISSEGKTFVSMNLATVLAMTGKKVLLVGLDLRKPRIHKVLGIDNGMGISSFLTGDNDYSEIVHPSGIENLYYAPSGPIPPNPAELIGTPRMQSFIEQAKKEFDYIIIDTPPIAIVTDALLVSGFVDAYILVVRQRYSSRSTLALIQDLYSKRTLMNLGIVINDISFSGYYGYGLRYGYASRYNYNYYGNYSYMNYGKKSADESYYTDNG